MMAYDDVQRIAALEKRLVEAQVQATESALDLFGVFDNPSAGPRDLYGDIDGFQAAPPGGVPPYFYNNRGRGEVLPVYTTWLQLKFIRDLSRRLCRENEFAICATENRRNYVVGDGFTYRATGPDDELNHAVQEVIDVWTTAIELSEYEIDAMERLDMDGEFFLRFFPRDSGLVELRFVEPEHVKDVAGDPWSPADSFGVVTDIDDVENIRGYQVLETPWANETPTLVDANEMMHVKLNVPRNAKRGLPTFYPVQGNLKRATELLASMAAMAKTRAKIALIRKFINATGAAAQNMAQSLSAATITDPTTNQRQTLERFPLSSILNSTGNIEYEMPGANVDAGGFVEVLQAELRGIAARLNMPEWMLTANNDSTNYAQSFVSESHAVKAFRRLQRMLCRRFGEARLGQHRSAVWRQIEYSVQLGVLPQEALTGVKIQCEGPSLISREKGEEAETNEIYYKMGLKSKSTISQELGLDRSQELHNLAKESEARAENISATAPVGVRQQESVQKGEAEDTPDLNEYVVNRFAAKGYPQREGEEAHNVHPETGFILRNGRAVQLGEPGRRRHEHYEAAPATDEMRHWGWPAGVINSSSGQFAGLQEMMRRNGMVRFTAGRGSGTAAVESAHPLTHQQKQAIHEFALKYKPNEVLFSRTTPIDEKGEWNYTHKIVSLNDLEDHLFNARESVQVTETRDDNGMSHKQDGEFVQPQWNTSKYPHLVDPRKKIEEINRRAQGLAGDYDMALQTHADNIKKLQAATQAAKDGEQVDPRLIQQLTTDSQKTLVQVKKAGEAAESAAKELTEEMPGPIKPTWDELDRILTSGPYHIISAGRNGNNPAHKDVPDEEFIERHKQLGEDLTNAGYKFTEIQGKYGGLTEPSYLAVAPETDAHVIRTIGFKHGQESVIHSHKGENMLAYTTGPSTGQAHHGTGFKYIPDAEDNFSEYTDSNGEKRRFALNLDFNELHEVTEAVAPQSGYTGFSAGDFRDMLHSYLPPKESTEELHDPKDVVKFYGDLSNTLKARTGRTLPEVLSDHRLGKLHTDAGETVIAALHGGPFAGIGRGEWDSQKRNKHGVAIGPDVKMTADPNLSNRRVKLTNNVIADAQNKTVRTNRFPILVGFNPGTGDEHGMIVAHRGVTNFPTRDTPALREKVGSGDAAILAKFPDVGSFLQDPKAIAAAQSEWQKLANSVKPKHLSTAVKGVQHTQAVGYFQQLQSLAGRGDKTAIKLLKDFGVTSG